MRNQDFREIRFLSKVVRNDTHFRDARSLLFQSEYFDYDKDFRRLMYLRFEKLCMKGKSNGNSDNR